MKRIVIFSFLFLFIFLMPIIAETPYKYKLGIGVWRKIDVDIKVEFILNSWRKNGNMEFGKGEDNFLDLFFHRSYNSDQTYPNEFTIKKSESGRGFFTVNHASREFLELDAIVQIPFIFSKIIFTIGDKSYIMRFDILDENSFELYVNEEHNKHLEHTSIDFYITEEFLAKYCILQEKNVPK